MLIIKIRIQLKMCFKDYFIRILQTPNARCMECYLIGYLFFVLTERLKMSVLLVLC